jgi:peroxiredoxin
MDSAYSNKAFAKEIGVMFPLLSDWKRKTTKDYGLYNEESGCECYRWNMYCF